jgi:glycosyltransferase involved in cell wall biosynthesis
MGYNIDKMRILVVTQYYYPESFAITPLCENLVQLGHRVQVVTSKPQYGFGTVPKDYVKITDEVISGVNIHRVKTFARKKTFLSVLLNYFTFYRSAIKAVQQLPGRFDVVLSVSLSPLISIAPAIRYARQHGLKHLLYAVDVWPESLLVTGLLKPTHWVYQWLKRWSLALYRQVDRILVGSPSYIKHFNQLLGKEKVIQTPLIQPALIESIGKEVMDFGEGFHFVYTGNLGTLQKLQLLVRAWPQTSQEDHLHLIGEGSQSQVLKQLVSQLKLEKRVHVYAHQTPENLGKFLAAADAFFVGIQTPGIVGKTIPHKLIQYLPFGQPILGYLQGDGRTLLTQLPPTYFLNARMANLKTLIKKIKQLTPTQRENMAKQHQQYYADHFAARRSAQRLADYLIELSQVTKA